jgi:hypothetical protein
MRLFLILSLSVFVNIAISAENYGLPIVNNVPIFQDNKVIKLGYCFIQTPSFKTLGTINTGYSLTDKFAIIGSVYLRELGTKNSNKVLYDAGIGYYKNYNDEMNFSVYIGYSNVTYYFERRQFFDIIFREYFHINKYYIMPYIGYNNEFFEIILSSRFALLQFYNTNSTDNKISEAIGGQNPDGFFRLGLNKGLFKSWEPAITIRLGWKFVHFQAQAGLMVTNISYSYKGFIPGTKRLYSTDINIGIIFTIPSNIFVKQ